MSGSAMRRPDSRAADVQHAPPAVGALQAEGRLARLVGVEDDAVRLEVVDAPDAVLAQHPHRGLVAQAVARGERVRDVQVGVVVDRDGGRDAALGPEGVGRPQRALRREHDATAVVGGAEGGVQAGQSGADHEDVRVDAARQREAMIAPSAGLAGRVGRGRPVRNSPASRGVSSVVTSVLAEPPLARWYPGPVADDPEDNGADDGVATSARTIAAGARDRAHFEEEALGLADDVWRVARRLARDQTEAEDLVQEAYARAFRSWRSYQPGTNLRAWLLRIVHNLAIDQARRRRRAPEQEPLEADDYYLYSRLEQGAGAEAPPTERLIERLSQGPILAALAELPQNFRDVVVYVDLAGLSYQEAADVLGIPIGTVMSRLHRGRRMIKTRLAEPALATGEQES